MAPIQIVRCANVPFFYHHYRSVSSAFTAPHHTMLESTVFLLLLEFFFIGFNDRASDQQILLNSWPLVLGPLSKTVLVYRVCRVSGFISNVWETWFIYWYLHSHSKQGQSFWIVCFILLPFVIVLPHFPFFFALMLPYIFNCTTGSQEQRNDCFLRDTK